MKIPLFPLQAVLFPDGILPLRVFEVRYTDMVRASMRSATPFGIVLLSKPTDSEINSESLPMHYHVGTLATVVDFDMQEPGVLMIAVKGGQRFRILTTSAQNNGLIMAEVELISDDAPTNVPNNYQICAELMAQLLDEIEAQYASTEQAGEIAFCPVVAKPYQLDDAVWLSNRHAELMPIPKSAKQALLELTDANERLGLIHAFLKGQDIV